eukprot:4738009-Amphidinium_carterae.1
MFFAKNFFPGPVSWPISVLRKFGFPSQGCSAGTSKHSIPWSRKPSRNIVAGTSWRKQFGAPGPLRGFGIQKPLRRGLPTEMQKKAF